MNHMEMSRLAKNPAGVRTLASTLKTLLGVSISDNENDFLSKLERFSDKDDLSVRQREYLWALKEKTSRKSMQGSYRASYLVKKLWEARCDFSVEDEEALEELLPYGDGLILSHAQWRWIIALCREVGLIEDEYITLN